MPAGTSDRAPAHESGRLPGASRREPELDDLARALAAVSGESRITTIFRLSDDLLAAAARSEDPAGAARRLGDVVRQGDGVSALAAIHALGAVADDAADRLLVELVADANEPFAAHAAWALAARRSSADAIDALERLVLGGGFSAMLAERTLLEWKRAGADLGSGPAADVRSADLGTTADDDRAVFDSLTAFLDSGPEASRGGIVVLQPFLHARLDRAGTSLGRGDAGGIASLLRSLGTALSAEDDVAAVITITRRHDGEPTHELIDGRHRVQRIEVGCPGPLPWREAWAHRVTIERELTAIGRALAERRVVWHLRMADVGTLAAAAAARRLGQPFVFTAVPDPHIVIDALQDSGRIDRSRFAMEDAAEQFWFRARMVERLTAQADRLTLLPRPTIERELVDLVGLDPAQLTERSTVIPEGVDIAQADGARDRLAHVAAQGATTAAVARVLESLPPARRHLPWLVSVGRLHPAKGAHRIVEAVVTDVGLRKDVNLVIVGGDIMRPSPDERSTIERIKHAAADAPDGLVTLTGHMPPHDVSDLVAFAASHGGVYVCASDKEEFGLAIVEAMAAGVVVVAPLRGGPRTYVDDGHDGVLCDTLDVDNLRTAIIRARTLVDTPGRAERTRATVRAELSIERMAGRLGEVYRSLVTARVDA